jgi:hypothetical protein
VKSALWSGFDHAMIWPCGGNASVSTLSAVFFLGVFFIEGTRWRNYGIDLFASQLTPEG